MLARTRLLKPRIFCSSLVLVFCARAVFGASEDGPTVEALAALIDEWQARADFKCHFRRRLIRSSSLAEALEGEGVEIPDAMFPPGADGWFYKLGRKARLGIDYRAPPKELNASAIPGLPPQSEAKAVTNVSFDEVGNGQFEVRFEPKRGTFGDVAWIAVRPENRSGVAIPGQRSTTWINPLTPLNTDVPNPLRFYDRAATAPATPDTLALRELGGDRIEVTLSRSASPPSPTESRRVVLWTKPALPVVERLDTSMSLADGGRLEHHVAVSDFQDCGGALVGRIVRHAIPGAPRDGGPTFTVIEWRSDDLGSQAPTDDDFVLELGEKTMIVGFAKPIQRGAIRRLNIDDVKMTDLDTTGGVRPPQTVPVSSAKRGRSNTTVIGVVLLNLAVGVAFVWFWTRRRTVGS
jgi:hypothetical protein